MSPLFVCSVVLVFVAIMISVAYVHQQMNETNKQQQRRIRELQARLQSTSALQTKLPAWYLSDIIADFFLNQQLLMLKRLEQLQKKDFSGQRNELLNQNKKQRNNNSSVPNISSEAQAKQLCGILEQTYQLAVQAHRRHEIDQPKTIAIHQRINHLKVATMYELLAQAAQRSWEEGQNPKLALHYYQLAKNELERNNTQNQYTEQIARLELTCEELNLLVEEQNKDIEESDDNPFIDKDSELWKKKHAFD